MDNKYRRENHIEYDEEAYNILMKNLMNIGTNSIKEIESACKEVDSIIDSTRPVKTKNTASILSAAQAQINEIKTLKETINYSLLAYDTCEKGLKNYVDKYIIDKLFENEDNAMKLAFQKNISQLIEDRDNDGVYEYKEDTDFNKMREYVIIAKDLDKRHLNYDLYGLSQDDILGDLIYIYDVHGRDRERNVLNAITYNCPSNFADYDFHPGIQIRSDGHYGYNSSIRNYQTNSEIISINGVDYDFAQVLPKDCTSTEMLAYNMCKANVINTMRTFPDVYLDYSSQKNQVVVLTCSNSIKSDNWGGLYDTTNFLFHSSGNVYIWSDMSFWSNTYTTRDTVIHEFGHKLDDNLVGNGRYESLLFSDRYFTRHNSSSWEKLYRDYKGILPGIAGGYSEETFDSMNKFVALAEFFAESMTAYFAEPDELKRLCPDVYEAITNIFGEDYGGIYNDRIDEVLNTSFDVGGRGNGVPKEVKIIERPQPTSSPQATPRPTPQPQPAPSPTVLPKPTPGPNN